MNWIEQKPKEGDTVKYYLNIPNETKIGVALRYHDGRLIIDTGRIRQYVTSQATFYVLHH